MEVAGWAWSTIVIHKAGPPGGAGGTPFQGNASPYSSTLVGLYSNTIYARWRTVMHAH
jgi:hypothetical protein